MVDEEKLRDMNGDQLRKINQNGILPLIMAHLFSLSSIRDLFARQAQQGKVPEQLAAMAAGHRRERLHARREGDAAPV